MAQAKRALVIGATGGVGGEVALALLRHGWIVHGLARDPVRRESIGWRVTPCGKRTWCAPRRLPT